MLNEDRHVQRPDGSTGVGRAVSLAAARELGLVDIVTYPSRITVWLPGNASRMNDIPALTSPINV
jgi:hypothetical protein